MTWHTSLDSLRGRLGRLEEHSAYLDKLRSAGESVRADIVGGIIARRRREIERLARDCREDAGQLRRVSQALRHRIHQLEQAMSSLGQRRFEMDLRLAIGEISPRDFDRMVQDDDLRACRAEALLVGVRADLAAIDEVLTAWRDLGLSLAVYRPGLADPEPSPDELVEILGDDSLGDLLTLPEPRPRGLALDETDDVLGLSELIHSMGDTLEDLVTDHGERAGRFPPELDEARAALELGRFVEADALLVELRRQRMDDPYVLALLAMARLENTERELQARIRAAADLHRIAASLDLGEAHVQGVLSRVRHRLASFGVPPSEYR